MLFVRDNPLEPRELQRVLNVPEPVCKKVLDELVKKCRGVETPIEIVWVGDGCAMQLNERYSNLLEGHTPPDLQKPVLRTLAMIAYHQPIFQSKLVELRGNVVYTHVRELVERGFINAEPSGRSKVLTTTTYFSEYFGVGPSPDEVRGVLRDMVGGPFIGCTQMAAPFCKLAGIERYDISDSPEGFDVFITLSPHTAAMPQTGEKIIYISPNTFKSIIDALETLSAYGSKKKVKKLKYEIEQLKSGLQERASRIGLRVHPMSEMIEEMSNELGLELSKRGVRVAPDYMRANAEIRIPTHQDTSDEPIKEITERYETLLKALESIMDEGQ